MPTATINGTPIYYLDEGAGKPLVFVHGLAATHAMFVPQVEAFRPTHRVICPDVRGNGRSGQLEGPVATVLDRQCDDIALLLGQLGIEKAVFCGVSYGGVFTYHFVLRYPELVEAIIVVDSFGDTKIVGITEFLLMASQPLGMWAYHLPASWLIPSVKFQYRKWPLAQEHLIQIIEEMRTEETVLQRKAINEANHTDQLHQVHCPTLGIVGNFTKVGVRYMERSLAPIEGSKLIVVDESFDPTNLCQPVVFNQLVRRFLEEIGWI